MSGLTLTIDAPRWRHHLDTVMQAGPGVVPVAKGNGYGLGLPRLASEAERLGAEYLAVGIPTEVDDVREHFSKDFVVLTPWRPENSTAVESARDPRVISTISRMVDLEVIANLGGGRPRIVAEVLTSMKRHGMNAQDLQAVLATEEFVQFEGWTIHLPILDKGRYAEALRLAKQALELKRAPLWMSHLTQEEANRLAGETGVPVRLRMGTKLWLGAPDTLQTTATVIDLHKVRRGERIGYRQRAMPSNGWIVVMAGGTSNGLGLEAPTAAKSPRARAISVATGSLEAAGLALSPYTIAGKKRWFAEPPHMQSSLVFLPERVTPPQVGDAVPVQVRLTTATVDETIETD